MIFESNSISFYALFAQNLSRANYPKLSKLAVIKTSYFNESLWQVKLVFCIWAQKKQNILRHSKHFFKNCYLKKSKLVWKKKYNNTW